MAEFIKTRLKLFFLSFFSNKTAREVPKTGFTPVILALLLSFLLLLLGYFGAATAPFASHLDDAEGYTEFIDNAFGAGKLALRVENGKLKSDTVVDTYTSNEDKSLYAINGYDLIADTRRSDMRIAFTQVAKKGNSEITYDEYRALSADEKKSYALETRYTNTELAISQEDVSRFERFLGSEEGAKDELAALDKTAESYADALYALYVKNYYTSVGSILRGSTVPVLRDYYYFTYIVGGKTSYFYVFDYMCAGSFQTDGGIPVMFGGYCGGYADEEITDVRGFIERAYYDTVGQTFSSYFLSMLMYLPVLVFVPIAAGLLMWGIGKLVKDGWDNTFGGCYKIVNSFVWVSALLSALAVFAGGWLTAARVMYMLIPALFGGILIVRTAIYCIMTAIGNKKSLDTVERDKKEEIFGGIL